PLVITRWNNGVHNWMLYGAGDIPVGDYNSANLANIGIGHGAADGGGGGYTYSDPKLGHEFSAVTGFTYNLIHPSTHNRNGFDWHLDWGASQFLTQQFFVGAVGYFYEQISPDRGCVPQLCPVRVGRDRLRTTSRFHSATRRRSGLFESEGLRRIRWARSP